MIGKSSHLDRLVRSKLNLNSGRHHSMKKFTVAVLSVLLTVHSLAITLKSSPDPDAHQKAPPASYNFKPWSSCAITLAQGVFSNGVYAGAVGSIWPIGPYVAVSSAHITTFVATPTDRYEKLAIGVGSRDFRYIKDVYVLGDDTILYTIHTNAGPFPSWNKMWRGPYYQPYTNSRVISGFTFTSIDTEKRILTNAFMCVGAGTFANNGQTYAPALAWEVATNTITGPLNYRPTLDESIQLIPREPYRVDNWARQYTSLGSGINNTLIGSVVYVIYDKHPEIPGYWPNFGARVGDSGSGLFIYQDGEWQLVGMANSGSFAPGSSTGFSVIDQVVGWTTNFWNTVGKPETFSALASIKDTQIPATGFYKDCAAATPALPVTTTPTPTPPVVVAPPATPPVATVPVIVNPATPPPADPSTQPSTPVVSVIIQTNVVTVTNWVTVPIFVTNTVPIFVTNTVPVYMTLQQRQAAERAIAALEYLRAVFGK